MKKSFNHLSWVVVYYDCNAQKIKPYDILKSREDFIKQLKKRCATKEEFSERMRGEMMYRYWSKCEWELIIEIDENDHIWLKPWVGCRDPENCNIDVTDWENGFDWRKFAKKHIGDQVYRNKAKIDVYDQLRWRWDEFIDYCWYTRLRYERDDAKFHREL